VQGAIQSLALRADRERGAHSRKMDCPRPQEHEDDTANPGVGDKPDDEMPPSPLRRLRRSGRGPEWQKP
jgi:hypothetical protein